MHENMDTTLDHLNRLELAVKDVIEAYKLQMEIIRRMAELGVIPETVGGEIERLEAEIEQKINAAA
ncbi:hypothetical protein [Paenibacillus sp. Root444D2]|uniref:hypothetical protein n=1 Tax=Paenibacillus sp. Root444D2 TaxID=1736538 RepID=UPI00071110C6|nr:hypothetical protein [Paenibacillus sp. Root444D2]KQX69304.1 hypothetical protein ASD40_02035 [Paenibacillus sp. Root444D2]